MKRIWLGLLTCALVTSCPQASSSSQTPQTTLELSVGTMNSLTVGTLFLAKVRKDGQLPTSNVTITLGTSPGAAPTEKQFYGANRNLGFYLFEKTPVAGEYTASVELGSETVTAKATLSDAKAILPFPVVTADKATVSSVPASWAVIPGAKSYQVALFSPTKGKALVETSFITESNTTLTPSSPLDAKKIYVVIVTAYTENLADPNVSLKAQVNASSNSGQVKF
jgi:hypothetical protein